MITSILIFAVIGFIFWTRFKINAGVRRLVDQKDSEGHLPAPTLLAKLGLGTLGADETLLARWGSGDTPQHDGQAITLRPTFGMRLMNLALLTLLMGLVWLLPGTVFPNDIAVAFGVTALAIYGGLHANLSYLRYDSHGFEVMGSAFNRRHVAWSELLDIRDNGHYNYVFKTTRGQVQALKFMAGMPGFLTYARRRMQSG